MLFTFPTAASPRRTSFTLLLGLGAVASAILRGTFGLMTGFMRSCILFQQALDAQQPVARESQDPAIIAMKLSGMKMFKSSTFLGLSMGCLNGLTA
jgi:hypothetical protein